MLELHKHLHLWYGTGLLIIGPTANPPLLQAYDCNGKRDCKNTDIDERHCETDEDRDTTQETGVFQGDSYWCLFFLESKIETIFRIDREKVCDLKCDCVLCDDEAECNGVSYGFRWEL